MIKFIAADLDGTLLDSNKRLPREFQEVIQKLHDRGVVFAPASGRQYASLLKQFSPFCEDFMYIAENGAMVVKDKKPIILDCMDTEDAKKVVQRVREIPTASALICCDDYAYGEEGAAEEFIYNAKMYYTNYKSVNNLLDCCEGGNICKIAIYDEVDAESNLYGQIGSLSSSRVVLSGDRWVDVMKEGVTKGSAIMRIQELFGWKREECMAFGDYLNDCEMLQACAYSYAMENAHEELKALANFTAPSNDRNGVMLVIKEVLQI